MCTRTVKIFIFLLFLSLSHQDNVISNGKQSCGEDGDCLSVPSECSDKCGCDSAYFYNETTGECIITPQVMQTIIEKYNPEDTSLVHESILAKSLRLEAHKIFKGIVVAAILFISCAGVCVITACIYCCKINYSDRVLKRDISALAKKIGREQKYRKIETKPKIDPIAENCSMVVDDGVFVV